MSAKFGKKALEKAGISPTDTEEEVSKALADAIVDEGLAQGVGFFLELGAKVKPPVIPIAVYADAKYQFFSMMPDAVDGPSITLELGGALAF